MYRHEVIVHRAGLEQANGKYEFDGWLNNYPCFRLRTPALPVSTSCMSTTTNPILSSIPNHRGEKFWEFIILGGQPTSELNGILNYKLPVNENDPNGPVENLSDNPAFWKNKKAWVLAHVRKPLKGSYQDAKWDWAQEFLPLYFFPENCDINPISPKQVDAVCALNPDEKSSHIHSSETQSKTKIIRRNQTDERTSELNDVSNKEQVGDRRLPPKEGWKIYPSEEYGVCPGGEQAPRVDIDNHLTDFWDVGSEVEVFSTSQQRWKRANIIAIIGDEFKVASEQDNWKSTVRRGSGRIRPGHKQLVERHGWDVDTAVEVYSTSKQRWKDALIIDTKPLRVEYTDGTGGKWMALGSDWLRKPGEPESPTDLLKSEGEGLSSHLTEVINQIFWSFARDSKLSESEIIEWLRFSTPRATDQIRETAKKIIKDYANPTTSSMSIIQFTRYYEDACHDRPKAVRHELVNLGHLEFTRKGHGRTWKNGTKVEAYSKTQKRWKRATIVHVIESGGKLHIQYCDNTGRKWMARYSDRLRPKFNLDIIYRTRRFAEMVKAVGCSEYGRCLPLSVTRLMLRKIFQQCNHCLYFDDCTLSCSVGGCNKRVCRSCGTDGIEFHDCKVHRQGSPHGNAVDVQDAAVLPGGGQE